MVRSAADTFSNLPVQQPACRATCPTSDVHAKQASQQHACAAASAAVGLALAQQGQKALESPPVGICSSGGVPVVGRKVQSRIQGSCNLGLGPCRALLLHCGPDLALHVRQGARLDRGWVRGGACGPLGPRLELGLLATAPKGLCQPAPERCFVSVVESDKAMLPGASLHLIDGASVQCVEVLHASAGCGCTGQLHCLLAGLACGERPSDCPPGSRSGTRSTRERQGRACIVMQESALRHHRVITAVAEQAGRE